VNPIKLSICIPTYNRAAHLRTCLQRIKAFSFDFAYEIVISDNASTDNTTEVVQEFAADMPIRYFLRSENNGPFVNVNGTYRRAHGEYSVYVADDDRLIYEGLLNALKFMDDNPAVNVCHAPWWTYDGILEREMDIFYRLEEDVIFQRRSFGEVFNFIYNKHIFPEIAVFRTSALRTTWVPRDICFYAFPLLAHFLDQGDIAFLKTPFYQQVIRSELGRDRPQGGHEIAMSGWDQYRGGLEYFLYFGTKRGQIASGENDKFTQDYMCKMFTLIRMTVALRLLLGSRQFVKAYEVYTRLMYGGLDQHPEVVAAREGLLLAAALETLAWQVNAAGGVENLVLSGFLDTIILKERIRKVNFPERIAIVDEPEAPSKDFIEKTAVLVFTPDQREHYLEQGYDPNLVFAQDDLIQTILL